MFKINLKHSNSTSNILLDIYFRIGGSLGLFPIWNNEKLHFINSSVLVVMYIIIAYFIKQYKFDIAPDQKLAILLAYIDSTMYVICDFIIVYQTFKNVNNWRIFFKYFLCIRRKSNMLEKEITSARIIAKLSFLTLFFCLNIYFSIINHLATWNKIETILTHFQWNLTIAQMLITIFFIAELSTIITNIIQSLFLQIDFLFSSYQISSADIYNKIGDIKYIYKYIHKTLEKFSDIFGVLMIVVLTVSFTTLLDIWNLITLSWLFQESVKILNINTSLIATLSVSTYFKNIECNIRAM